MLLLIYREDRAQACSRQITLEGETITNELKVSGGLSSLVRTREGLPMRKIAVLAVVLGLCATAANADPKLAAVFAPQGELRAVINTGNAVLARRVEGQPATGVSVDLANELARRLGVSVRQVVVPAAAMAVDTVRQGNADIGFFAIDPARSEGIAFTTPYVSIAGAYAVPQGSPINSMEEVDRPGIRIVVGRNSAYDFFLSRQIKAATLVRTLTSQTVVPQLFEQKFEVAANVRQQLEADVAKYPGALRLLPGDFMTIHQAMGLAGGRHPQGIAFLTAFVEEMKSSGFVREALQRHGIEGAAVSAPGMPK